MPFSHQVTLSLFGSLSAVQFVPSLLRGRLQQLLLRPHATTNFAGGLVASMNHVPALPTNKGPLFPFFCLFLVCLFVCLKGKIHIFEVLSPVSPLKS